MLFEAGGRHFRGEDKLLMFGVVLSGLSAKVLLGAEKFSPCTTIKDAYVQEEES